MIEGYPVLEEDIFFAKIQNDLGVQVRVRNTSTEKDFKAAPDTVALLDLCTGTSSVAQIIAAFCAASGEPEETVVEEVHTALKALESKHIVRVAPAPLKGRRAKEVKVQYPVEFAQLEITNRCNLSCLHCVNDSGDPCPDELTTEEILDVIDQLSFLGVHQLTLTGGEPLLHPDLFAIVEHARKAPMTVALFTNGTLLTADHVELLKELGVARIAVSIDSINKEIHDTFRGKKGALEKTLRSIRILRKAGLSVNIAVSINQYNKHEMVDIIEFLKDKGLTDYQFAEVSFSGRGIEGVAISPEEYYQVLIEQLTYLREEYPEEIKAPALKLGEGCGIAQSEICIKADGSIIPCHGFTQGLRLGNVSDCDLAEFWNENRTLKDLRKMRTDTDEACKGCAYLPFCEGCIANAFIMEEELRCYDPYSCARLRAYDEVCGIDR